VRVAKHNVLLTWPASATGFDVQTTTAVSRHLAVRGAYATVEGDVYRVTVPAEGPARFYRS